MAQQYGSSGENKVATYSTKSAIALFNPCITPRNSASPFKAAHEGIAWVHFFVDIVRQ